jgi:E3 ubiquitin-protein ligase ZNF598
MVEIHGPSMTSRDKKDARRIQADFEFEEVGLGGRNERSRRGRDREPESLLRDPIVLGPSSIRLNGVNRRMEGFGTALTTERPNNTSDSGLRRSPSPSSNLRDPATIQWVFTLVSSENIGGQALIPYAEDTRRLLCDCKF